ncbi:MAG: peptidoglycan editing factor PgeF, partial [Thermomicrobiaceae bacterium]|nr:peptidoglycan editing factor PgeF [Thermomicrobiaceae bacterium]
VHGAAVRVVEPGDAGRGAHSFADAIPGTDALVTATPGLPIAVFCADCVPILLYDPRHRVVAAVHAGWRGTVANVAGRAVATMRERFGTQPIELLAGIGPSIGPCCYEVGEEVESAWAAAGVDHDGVALRRESASLRFDLWRANALALQAAGVREERIEIAAVCTACHVDRFFSHRAERGRTGRFAAIIAVDAR